LAFALGGECLVSAPSIFGLAQDCPHQNIKNLLEIFVTKRIFNDSLDPENIHNIFLA